MEKLKFFGEVLGLSPFKERMAQAKIAIMGQEDVPGSKFGLSSLSQFHPIISPRMWRGKTYKKGKVLISNLVNHTQTPIENGWSVKKTQVKDFRGKRLTYDSHNGTDFAIPVGTTVCTAAVGEVVAIMSEFNRGGLKVFIDHGEGLMTCYAHLARPLVSVGEVLERGQSIALSGYSGLDALISFPFGIPHVHFNVWLNGEPIDPFPHSGQQSMWVNGEMPTSPKNVVLTPKPIVYEEDGWIYEPPIFDFKPSTYSEEKVNELISACKTISAKERLSNLNPLKTKAAHVIIHSNYYPTRFTKRVNIYDKEYPRSPRLDLPFSEKEFDGVLFLDEL